MCQDRKATIKLADLNVFKNYGLKGENALHALRLLNAGYSHEAAAKMVKEMVNA